MWKQILESSLKWVIQGICLNGEGCLFWEENIVCLISWRETREFFIWWSGLRFFLKNRNHFLTKLCVVKNLIQNLAHCMNVNPKAHAIKKRYWLKIRRVVNLIGQILIFLIILCVVNLWLKVWALSFYAVSDTTINAVFSIRNCS